MIGRARDRAVLQREQPIADGGGGYEPGWVDVATIWAAVEPAGGGESVAGGGLAALSLHRVRIRRRAGVAPAMRLVIGGRAFNIRAVFDRDPGRPWLELLCEEGAAT